MQDDILRLILWQAIVMESDEKRQYNAIYAMCSAIFFCITIQLCGQTTFIILHLTMRGVLWRLTFSKWDDPDFTLHLYFKAIYTGVCFAFLSIPSNSQQKTSFLQCICLKFEYCPFQSLNIVNVYAEIDSYIRQCNEQIKRGKTWKWIFQQYWVYSSTTV